MAEQSDVAVPVFQDYMNPMLTVLRDAQRPLPIEELDRRIVAAMRLPGDVTSVPHDPEKPDRSEVGYRIAWARTYLKKSGLLDNPGRGIWGLTDKGRDTPEVDARALATAVAQGSKTPSGEPDGATATLAEDDEVFAGRVADKLAQELRGLYEHMVAEGSILTSEQAAKCYARFRERFGPEVLAGLDGEALLNTMHGRGTKDSLVYWLEFKNDEDFPVKFGGIGGGSALKFGIFQSAETSRWMVGEKGKPVPVTMDEAIQRVRKQRDELVEGTRLVTSYARDPRIVDFAELQERLTATAPELAETSWGHKYFSLMAPNLIEPFHGAEHQRHHLIKMLKEPAEGRYENARIFVGVAAQLGLSLYELGATLTRRNAGPHQYWRVGTTEEGGRSEWPRMREGGFMAIGWDALGDLSATERNMAHKASVRELMEKHYPASNPAVVTKAANQVFGFVTRPQERDIVVAMEGATVRGIGRVTGDYYFQDGDGPFPHRRPVDWLRTSDWKLKVAEGLRTTFHPLGKYPANLIDIEARLLGVELKAPSSAARTERAAIAAPPPLRDLLARIQSNLGRKRQVILYGPPGTGKTYYAANAARELAARSWFQSAYADLDQTKRDALVRDGAIETCTFHPAYGYEDFLEGYRPVERGGGLGFELRDGVFKRVCKRAQQNEKRHYYLIVDEINRGDIPRIFGELLTVLEADKRGIPISLPLSGEAFVVPKNVFVIGTMNTADRSIALLDAALRRRFGFIELMPDSSTLQSAMVSGIPLGPWLDELNRRVVRHAGRDARNLQIGHAYLMPGGTPVTTLPRFAELLRDDIIPLLEEYCYEDFDALEKILGSTIVRRDSQRIDERLFSAEGLDNLAEALVSGFAQITTTSGAVRADTESEAHSDLDTDTDDEADASQSE